MRIADDRRRWKDVVYEAFSPDGSMTPPVVFTSDTSVPLGDYHPLQIYQFDGIKGPRWQSTFRWIDEVSPTLPAKVLMIWDDLPAHRNPKVLQELEANNIEVFTLPHASHGLLNPCDNSLNALIRRQYYKGDRSTHQNMLMSARDAFNSISDETVVEYFKHTGIIGEDDPPDIADSLANEGYHADEVKEEHVQSMKQAFRDWKHGLRKLDGLVRHSITALSSSVNS